MSRNSTEGLRRNSSLSQKCAPGPVRCWRSTPLVWMPALCLTMTSFVSGNAALIRDSQLPDGTSPMSRAIPIGELKRWQLSTAIDANQAVHVVLHTQPRNPIWHEGERFFEIDYGPHMSPPGLDRPKLWSVPFTPMLREQVYQYYTVFGGDQLGVIESVFFTDPNLDDPRMHYAHVKGWPDQLVFVPEAPTVALCGLGLAGLLGTRKR